MVRGSSRSYSVIKAKSSFCFKIGVRLSVSGGDVIACRKCVLPDISLAVGKLARHAAAPGPAHVRAAKRVVMYLYNTRTLGITYYRDCSQPNVSSIYEGAKHPLVCAPNVFQTFADSDYVANDSRRSTMGNDRYA